MKLSNQSLCFRIHCLTMFGAVLAVLCCYAPARAFSLENPEHRGLGFNAALSFDPPPTFSFYQLSAQALYDYEDIFWHRAPDSLKFKLEANLGLADFKGTRFIGSMNFYALYYLDSLATPHFRPYLEGGVGLVYNDFQVEGQGMRWNFDPQAGVGCEWRLPSGVTWYGALRAYHSSNGQFDRQHNRGLNAVMLQFGYLFKAL